MLLHPAAAMPSTLLACSPQPSVSPGPPRLPTAGRVWGRWEEEVLAQAAAERLHCPF